MRVCVCVYVCVRLYITGFKQRGGGQVEVNDNSSIERTNERRVSASLQPNGLSEVNLHVLIRLLLPPEAERLCMEGWHQFS